MAELPDFQRHQYEFAAHLRDPEHCPAPADVEGRRMQIYRDLFFNNVCNLLGGTFPVLHEIMGANRWALLIRDFYRDHESHSPLFPDLPKEFLQYLADERVTGKQTDEETDPPFLYELAHYEWVEAGLLLAPDPEEISGLEADGDLLAGKPVTSSVAWLLAYAWPVNEIGLAFQPSEPAAQPLYYLLYRNSDDTVTFLKVNATSARLFEILAGNAETTGHSALSQLAAELQHPNPAKVIEGGAGILRNWLDRGVLRGIVPAA